MNCQHTQTEDRVNGPHIGRYCVLCGAWLQWVPKHISPSNAGEFVMPFGKHKGKQIRELENETIAWYLANLSDSSVKRKIEAYWNALQAGETE